MRKIRKVYPGTNVMTTEYAQELVWDLRIDLARRVDEAIEICRKRKISLYSNNLPKAMEIAKEACHEVTPNLHDHPFVIEYLVDRATGKRQASTEVIERIISVAFKAIADRARDKERT